MQTLRNQFTVDPFLPLLAADNDAIRFFVRRDFTGEEMPPVETLWQLPAVIDILKRQLPSGAWSYHEGT